MTTFLLIRHAQCDPIGHVIAGRTPGVHLNAEGRVEAEALADRLSGLAISAVYSSPLERTLETAAAIATRHGLGVIEEPGLIEVDFGDWTGKTLRELDGQPEWRRFNHFRSGTRIPGGESMAEVLSRTVNAVDAIWKARHQPGTLVALVSHGDVLRCLVAHLLGLPLDFLLRFEISPSSVSVATLDEYGPRVLLLNSMTGWPKAVPTQPS
jgi:probable phosphomutase (TIGR03848 family)